MEALESVYLICFFFGLAFVFISFLLGGVFGGANGSADFGHGGDGGLGGVHDGWHGVFPFFSPFTLSFFSAAFGGGGILSVRVLGWSPGASVVTAAGSGVAFAALAVYLLGWLQRASSGTSHATVADLLGKEAEVTVSIPARGVGQIAYVHNTRQTAPARSIDDSEIPVKSIVKIRSILGNTFYVERIP